MLFGSVVPEAQAVVAIFVTVALLCAGRQPCPGIAAVERTGFVLLAVLAFLTVVPVAPWLLGEERRALMRDFPSGGLDETAWAPLSLTPSTSIQRLWELCVAVGMVFLGHRHARQGTAWRMWFPALVGAVLTQGAVAVVMWRSGSDTVWGLWKIPWGVGAGTFANRNFFALWCFMAALLLIGWVIREYAPFRLSTVRESSISSGHRRIWRGWVAGAAAVLAASIAVASGSRGAFLAFFVGLLLWTAQIVASGHRPLRRAWCVCGVVLITVILVGAGSSLLRRVSSLNRDYAGDNTKLSIWREAVKIWGKFPISGAGLGSFEHASNHYKSGNGDLAFRHVENDYLQLLAETGFAGALVVGFGLIALARPITQRLRGARLDEPELAAGAVSALGAFLTHAAVDFPAQIPALLWFAAALLGMLSGSAACARPPDEGGETKPRQAGKIGSGLLAVLVLVGAVAHLVAFGYWQRARRETAPDRQLAMLETSLSWWPWQARRVVAFARTAGKVAEQEPASRRAAFWIEKRKRVLHYLSWNRLDWEVRLELLAMDAMLWARVSEVRRDASRLLALCPLNPRLPIEVARIMGPRDPEWSLETLRKAAKPIALQRDILELGWSLKTSADSLWTLTASGDAALVILVEFALARNLPGTAVEALSRIEHPLNPEWICESYLRAGRADLALKAMPRGGGEHYGYWRARAFSQLGKSVDAWKELDAIVSEAVRNRGLAALPGELGLLNARYAAASARGDVEEAVRMGLILVEEFLKKSGKTDAPR